MSLDARQLIALGTRIMHFQLAAVALLFIAVFSALLGGDFVRILSYLIAAACCAATLACAGTINLLVRHLIGSGKL